MKVGAVNIFLVDPFLAHLCNLRKAESRDASLSKIFFSLYGKKYANFSVVTKM